MKVFEQSFIKLQYDEHGRLYIRSFKNVRTNSVSYINKKRREYFSSYNPETDILAEYDMVRDVFHFVVKKNSTYFWNPFAVYPYKLSDFMKRYIKKAR